MESYKKTGKTVGALFIIVMVSWGISFALIESILSAPDYLTKVYPNKAKVIVGVIFELIDITAVVGISVVMFPVFKKQNESMALGYIGLRLIECLMLVVGILCALSLITVSREYIQTEASDVSHFQNLGILLTAVRTHWSMLVLTTFYSLAALIFYYFLHQKRLIPRFLSIWGFLAAILVVIDQFLLEIFGVSTGPISAIAMGGNEIILGIWLALKGFYSPIEEIASTS